MPVRINLKELFGSDSQTITVDKLNFNFNKLLELGIGLQGARGITGGTGSIGPSGIKGDQGDKGNQWFVGNSDPNITTFPGLMDEDFYVLTDNSQIWQYDELTDTWNVIVDLGGIVNNYLNTAGTTFVRGFGEGSPQDSRYIMFPNRGNTLTDQQGDKIVVPSGTNNDILLLSNFNETLQSTVLDISNDLTLTDKYYTAIQKIYVDRSNAVDKRYHLELGSLNDVAPLGAPFTLSSLNENLKLRHEYKNGIFNGVFSLTKLETGSPSTILHNGIFDFQYSKFQAGPLVQKEGFVQMGSRYAHLAMGRSYAEFDGINFNTSGVGDAGIGIGENFDNLLPHVNGNSYLVLKSDNVGVNGIMLDTDVYQDNGNIEQLGTGPVAINTSIGTGVNNLANNQSTYGLTGIAVVGNKIIQVSGKTTTAYPAILLSDPIFEGYMFTSDLNNPNSPIAISTAAGTGQSANGVGLLPSGAAINDIAVSGDLAYIISNLQSGVHTSTTVGSNVYNRINLQIVRFDTESGADFNTVSQVNSTWLDGAHRIKLNGSRAIVATNHLRGWGNPAGNAVNSQFEHDGYITAVSIINEEAANPVAIVRQDRTHHLDLEVANNKAYTISIEFNAPVGTNHPGFGVSVRSYDLNEVVDGLSPLGMSLGTESKYNIVPPNATNIGSSNYDNLTSINKFGAISVSGDIVWAVHRNMLYTLKQDSVSGTFIPLNILEYDVDINMRAIDIEVIGESIYILCASGNTGVAYSPTNTHIVKVNKHNVSTPTIVSKTDLNEPSSSRLIVDGNNIYVNKTSGNTGYLIPIEIDGFKSDAINVGSVKSSNGNITKDLKVGHNLNVGQSINVGKGGIKAVGPVTSGNILTNRLGVNFDGDDLEANDYSAQISGNLILKNILGEGDSKIHFNVTTANKHTEIVNLSPDGKLSIVATPDYTTTNNPNFLGTLNINGGGSNGIYIITPDSASTSIVGDIKIRPGNYTPPDQFPIAGQPPYFKEGVIVLERRVQMVDSVNGVGNGIGGNFANTFNSPTLWLRRSISGGNWATNTFGQIVRQNSTNYDRIIRFTASGTGGTPPARLSIWVDVTPGSGSSTTPADAGGWHVAKRILFDPYLAEQVIIPACHRFYVEVGAGISNGWTSNINITEYRFGKMEDPCVNGNLPIFIPGP